MSSYIYALHIFYLKGSAFMCKIIENKNYDYYSLKKAIKQLTDTYPFLHTSVIGKSVMGREITAIKIGRANEYVLFTGCFHGSEHITTTILLKFIEEICTAIQNGGSVSGINIKRVMTGRAIIIVPSVNPDGAEISMRGVISAGNNARNISKISRGDTVHWNANVRGVDINHNFDAGWDELSRLEKENGIYGPSPTRFGGPKPFSEPESVAIKTLCETVRIRHAIAFHSQGEVIYWQYGDYKPARSQKMAEIMATSSGYKLDYPVGLAVGGGFKDWFIKTFNRPAFTVEVGLGENPLPNESVQDIYERIKEMLILSVAM